ncbi:MAG: plasmid pRiA4b ORF-3 family protein [Candidatus Altiarchaeales archaeon]|nr:plasmid pRiA4b ORF-3 family protein [Candidatus Altiarchaeales archaeon]
MAKIDGRKRYWVPEGKSNSEKSNKTVIFDVIYMGQCGCGYEEEITRKIELKESQTLDDLHEAIIYKSFKWFDPHLYSFYLDNKPYSKNKKMEYSCDPRPDPLDGKVPNSSSIKLRELNLRKNQRFLFVFDFGDDHHVGIKVEGFGEIQKGKKYPSILEEKGKAPGQYPDYDE